MVFSINIHDIKKRLNIFLILTKTNYRRPDSREKTDFSLESDILIPWGSSALST